jgi:hypothetical protein
MRACNATAHPPKAGVSKTMSEKHSAFRALVRDSVHIHDVPIGSGTAQQLVRVPSSADKILSGSTFIVHGSIFSEESTGNERKGLRSASSGHLLGELLPLLPRGGCKPCEIVLFVVSMLTIRLTFIKEAIFSIAHVPTFGFAFQPGGWAEEPGTGTG